MLEMGRVSLYRQLTESDFLEGNVDYRSIIGINISILDGVEQLFLTSDDVEHQQHNVDVMEFLNLLDNNIRIAQEYLRTIESEKLYRIYSDLLVGFRLYREQAIYSITAKQLFNRVLRELQAANHRAIGKVKVPTQMLEAHGKRIVFLSHAYDDKLYTFSLFSYFYQRDIYLYIDWMHQKEHEDGIEIKRNLDKALRQSEQLLFLRSSNSELNIRGNHMIRQWCAWELGNYYAKNKVGKKYVLNLYSIDKYENMMYHGMKVFTGIDESAKLMTGFNIV